MGSGISCRATVISHPVNYYRPPVHSNEQTDRDNTSPTVPTNSRDSEANISFGGGGNPNDSQRVEERHASPSNTQLGGERDNGQRKVEPMQGHSKIKVKKRIKMSKKQSGASETASRDKISAGGTLAAVNHQEPSSASKTQDRDTGDSKPGLPGNKTHQDSNRQTGGTVVGMQAVGVEKPKPYWPVSHHQSDWTQSKAADEDIYSNYIQNSPVDPCQIADSPYITGTDLVSKGKGKSAAGYTTMLYEQQVTSSSDKKAAAWELLHSLHSTMFGAENAEEEPIYVKVKVTDLSEVKTGYYALHLVKTPTAGNLKKLLHNSTPIGMSMDAMEDFQSYEGGVLADFIPAPVTVHSAHMSLPEGSLPEIDYEFKAKNLLKSLKPLSPGLILQQGNGNDFWWVPEDRRKLMLNYYKSVHLGQLQNSKNANVSVISNPTPDEFMRQKLAEISFSINSNAENENRRILHRQFLSLKSEKEFPVPINLLLNVETPIEYITNKAQKSQVLKSVLEAIAFTLPNLPCTFIVTPEDNKFKKHPFKFNCVHLHTKSPRTILSPHYTSSGQITSSSAKLSLRLIPQLVKRVSIDQLLNISAHSQQIEHGAGCLPVGTLADIASGVEIKFLIITEDTVGEKEQEEICDRLTMLLESNMAQTRSFEEALQISKHRAAHPKAGTLLAIPQDHTLAYETEWLFYYTNIEMTVTPKTPLKAEYIAASPHNIHFAPICSTELAEKLRSHSISVKLGDDQGVSVIKKQEKACLPHPRPAAIRVYLNFTAPSYSHSSIHTSVIVAGVDKVMETVRPETHGILLVTPKHATINDEQDLMYDYLVRGRREALCFDIKFLEDMREEEMLHLVANAKSFDIDSNGIPQGLKYCKVANETVRVVINKAVTDPAMRDRVSYDVMRRLDKLNQMELFDKGRSMANVVRKMMNQLAPPIPGMILVNISACDITNFYYVKGEMLPDRGSELNSHRLYKNFNVRYMPPSDRQTMVGLMRNSQAIGSADPSAIQRIKLKQQQVKRRDGNPTIKIILNSMDDSYCRQQDFSNIEDQVLDILTSISPAVSSTLIVSSRKTGNSDRGKFMFDFVTTEDQDDESAVDDAADEDYLMVRKPFTAHIQQDKVYESVMEALSGVGAVNDGLEKARRVKMKKRSLKKTKEMEENEKPRKITFIPYTYHSNIERLLQYSVHVKADNLSHAKKTITKQEKDVKTGTENAMVNIAVMINDPTQTTSHDMKTEADVLRHVENLLNVIQPLKDGIIAVTLDDREDFHFHYYVNHTILEYALYVIEASRRRVENLLNSPRTIDLEMETAAEVLAEYESNSHPVQLICIPVPVDIIIDHRTQHLGLTNTSILSESADRLQALRLTQPGTLIVSASQQSQKCHFYFYPDNPGLDFTIRLFRRQHMPKRHLSRAVRVIPGDFTAMDSVRKAERRDPLNLVQGPIPIDVVLNYNSPRSSPLKLSDEISDCLKKLLRTSRPSQPATAVITPRTDSCDQQARFECKLIPNQTVTKFSEFVVSVCDSDPLWRNSHQDGIVCETGNYSIQKLIEENFPSEDDAEDDAGVVIPVKVIVRKESKERMSFLPKTRVVRNVLKTIKPCSPGVLLIETGQFGETVYRYKPDSAVSYNYTIHGASESDMAYVMTYGMLMDHDYREMSKIKAMEKSLERFHDELAPVKVLIGCETLAVTDISLRKIIIDFLAKLNPLTPGTLLITVSEKKRQNYKYYYLPDFIMSGKKGHADHQKNSYRMKLVKGHQHEVNRMGMKPIHISAADIESAFKLIKEQEKEMTLNEAKEPVSIAVLNDELDGIYHYGLLESRLFAIVQKILSIIQPRVPASVIVTQACENYLLFDYVINNNNGDIASRLKSRSISTLNDKILESQKAKNLGSLVSDEVTDTLIVKTAGKECYELTTYHVNKMRDHQLEHAHNYGIRLKDWTPSMAVQELENFSVDSVSPEEYSKMVVYTSNGKLSDETASEITNFLKVAKPRKMGVFSFVTDHLVFIPSAFVPANLQFAVKSDIDADIVSGQGHIVLIGDIPLRQKIVEEENEGTCQGAFHFLPDITICMENLVGRDMGVTNEMRHNIADEVAGALWTVDPSTSGVMVLRPCSNQDHDTQRYEIEYFVLSSEPIELKQLHQRPSSGYRESNYDVITMETPQQQLLSGLLGRSIRVKHSNMADASHCIIRRELEVGAAGMIPVQIAVIGNGIRLDCESQQKESVLRMVKSMLSTLQPALPGCFIVTPAAENTFSFHYVVDDILQDYAIKYRDSLPGVMDQMLSNCIPIHSDDMETIQKVRSMERSQLEHNTVYPISITILFSSKELSCLGTFNDDIIETSLRGEINNVLSMLRPERSSTIIVRLTESDLQLSFMLTRTRHYTIKQLPCLPEHILTQTLHQSVSIDEVNECSETDIALIESKYTSELLHSIYQDRIPISFMVNKRQSIVMSTDEEVNMSQLIFEKINRLQPTLPGTVIASPVTSTAGKPSLKCEYVVDFSQHDYVLQQKTIRTEKMGELYKNAHTITLDDLTVVSDIRRDEAKFPKNGSTLEGCCEINFISIRDGHSSTLTPEEEAVCQYLLKMVKPTQKGTLINSTNNEKTTHYYLVNDGHLESWLENDYDSLDRREGINRQYGVLTHSPKDENRKETKNSKNLEKYAGTTRTTKFEYSILERPIPPSDILKAILKVSIPVYVEDSYTALMIRAKEKQITGMQRHTPVQISLIFHGETRPVGPGWKKILADIHTVVQSIRPTYPGTVIVNRKLEYRYAVDNAFRELVAVMTGGGVNVMKMLESVNKSIALRPGLSLMEDEDRVGKWQQQLASHVIGTALTKKEPSKLVIDYAATQGNSLKVTTMISQAPQKESQKLDLTRIAARGAFSCAYDGELKISLYQLVDVPTPRPPELQRIIDTSIDVTSLEGSLARIHELQLRFQDVHKPLIKVIQNFQEGILKRGASEMHQRVTHILSAIQPACAGTLIISNTDNNSEQSISYYYMVQGQEITAPAGVNFIPELPTFTLTDKNAVNFEPRRLYSAKQQIHSIQVQQVLKSQSQVVSVTCILDSLQDKISCEQQLVLKTDALKFLQSAGLCTNGVLFVVPKANQANSYHFSPDETLIFLNPMRRSDHATIKYQLSKFEMINTSRKGHRINGSIYIDVGDQQDLKKKVNALHNSYIRVLGKPHVSVDVCIENRKGGDIPMLREMLWPMITQTVAAVDPILPAYLIVTAEPEVKMSFISKGLNHHNISADTLSHCDNGTSKKSPWLDTK